MAGFGWPWVRFLSSLAGILEQALAVEVFLQWSKMKGISHLICLHDVEKEPNRTHTHKYPMYDSICSHFHVFIHTHTFKHT